MELGFDLRTARLNQSLSQTELAAKSGLSLRQVKALEIGTSQNPHPDTVRRLRVALSLSLTSSADTWFKERTAFLHQLSSLIRQAVPGVRYLELIYEQIGATSYTYSLSEIYDDAGAAIADERFEAVAEIFDEHVNDYLHHVGHADDSAYLDIAIENTLLGDEFSRRVTAPICT